MTETIVASALAVATSAAVPIIHDADTIAANLALHVVPEIKAAPGHFEMAISYLEALSVKGVALASASAHAAEAGLTTAVAEIEKESEALVGMGATLIAGMKSAWKL